MDDLIWVILEGDPRKEISEEDAEEEDEDEEEGEEEAGGGSPRAITDDARICLILDCCRCLTFVEVEINSNF